MTQNIQYTFHLILNSKYKLLINVSVFFLIYLTLYNNNIIYCMTEGDAPLIAETTLAPSHQVQAIKREIVDYAQLHRPVGDIFELERIRVHEKLIAYTNMEPDEIITNLEKRKQRIWNLPTNRLTYEQLSSPHDEKRLLFADFQVTIQEWLGNLPPLINLPTSADIVIHKKKIYYLLRKYRRLNGISR